MKKLTSILTAVGFGLCMVASPLAAQDTTHVNKTTKDRAKQGTHAVGHGAKKVGKGTKNVAKKVGKGTKKAGKAVTKTVKKGVDKVD